MKNTPPRNPNSGKKPFDFSTYARYTNFVFILIVCVAIGLGAGYFADKLFELTIPLFKVLFAFAGVLLGLYIVIKEVLKP